MHCHHWESPQSRVRVEKSRLDSLSTPKQHSSPWLLTSMPSLNSSTENRYNLLDTPPPSIFLPDLFCVLNPIHPYEQESLISFLVCLRNALDYTFMEGDFMKMVLDLDIHCLDKLLPIFQTMYASANFNLPSVNDKSAIKMFEGEVLKLDGILREVLVDNKMRPSSFKSLFDSRWGEE